MSIDCILRKEELGFVRNLLRTEPAAAILRLRLAPFAEQFAVGAPRSEFFILPQAPEFAQLGVADAHVCLVGLDVGGRDRLQLCSRGSGQERLEYRQGEVPLGFLESAVLRMFSQSRIAYPMQCKP